MVHPLKGHRRRGGFKQQLAGQVDSSKRLHCWRTCISVQAGAQRTCLKVSMPTCSLQRGAVAQQRSHIGRRQHRGQQRLKIAPGG